MGDSLYEAEVNGDVGRLEQLLERVVAPLARENLPRVALAPPLTLLNLACGSCDEAQMLADFCARLAGPEARAPVPVHVIGADVRTPQLEEARARFRSSAERKFEFLAADASRLDEHRELPGAVDVVFFRHQNLFHGRRLWHRIFDQGLSKLSEDGLLVITSYFDREHELAIRAFENLGAELVASRRHAASRPLDTPGKTVDRHLAVFRRCRARGAAIGAGSATGPITAGAAGEGAFSRRRG
jgi:hypothetical protein